MLDMKIANAVQTPTNSFVVGTSTRDGWMYLVVQKDGVRLDIKLTDENKDALRTVLGPTETWNGIWRSK